MQNYQYQNHEIKDQASIIHGSASIKGPTPIKGSTQMIGSQMMGSASMKGSPSTQSSNNQQVVLMGEYGPDFTQIFNNLDLSHVKQSLNPSDKIYDQIQGIVNQHIKLPLQAMSMQGNKMQGSGPVPQQNYQQPQAQPRVQANQPSNYQQPSLQQNDYQQKYQQQGQQQNYQSNEPNYSNIKANLAMIQQNYGKLQGDQEYNLVKLIFV